MSDYLQWFLFSVIVSLSHLVIAKIVLLIFKKTVSFEEILLDGSLLFFAMCLSATSFSDFLLCDKELYKGLVTLACFGMVVIGLVSMAAYVALIVFKFVLSGESRYVNPRFVFRLSVGVSLGAFAYSSTLFFILYQTPASSAL